MRSTLENNRGRKLDLESVRFGVVRPLQLTGDYEIPADAPMFHFLDPGAASRDVTLPAFKRGAIYGVVHIGAANDLVVKDSSGSTIATLNNVQGALFVCSGNEWKYFTNTSSDLLDPTEISSPLGSITVTVNGGAVELEVDASAIDHDALLNYDANKHIDHTAVSISAGTGLTGGGDISSTRTLSLDINGLTAETSLATGDFLAFYDLSATALRKMTLAVLNGFLDHDALTNFFADEHVAHSGVSITAGVGLSGGGDISASRTIDLDFTELTADTPTANDLLAFADVSGLDHNKVTFGDLITALSIVTTSNMDAELLAIAGLTSAADQVPYFTGLGTAALATFTSYGRSIVAVADEAAFKAAVNLEIGVDVQAYNANYLKSDTTATLTKGYSATPYNAGTKSSGTFTPDEANGNLQYAVNGGAHTLAPPTNNCSIVIQYTNNVSAGAITTSGFTKVSGSFTTTNGDDFMCYIMKLNGFSHLNIVALQ